MLIVEQVCLLLPRCPATVASLPGYCCYGLLMSAVLCRGLGSLRAVQCWALGCLSGIPTALSGIGDATMASCSALWPLQRGCTKTVLL